MSTQTGRGERSSRTRTGQGEGPPETDLNARHPSGGIIQKLSGEGLNWATLLFP